MKNAVLHLTPSAEDHPGAGGRTRIVSEIRYAVGEHYPIIILCLVPIQKLWHPWRLFKARRALAQDAGTRVVYWPSLPSFGRVWLNRLADGVNSFSVFLVSQWFSVKGIHAQGLSAATTALASRRFGFKGFIIFDVHGASVEEHTYRTDDSHGAWVEELETMERAALNCTDLVVYVSRGMYEHYHTKYGFTPRNWVLIPCATSAEVVLDGTLRSRLRQELLVQDKLVFLYSGSYRKYQLVDEMIHLFIQIKQKVPDAFFLILTSHLTDFQASADKHALCPKDYRLLSVTHDEVFKISQAADIGFLLRADSVVNLVASPTKFAEYCICGVPVLLTPFVGDYSEEAKEFQVGYVIDKLEITPQLLKFIQNVRTRRDLYAERCHTYARDHVSWKQAGETLRSAYEKLLGGQKSEDRCQRTDVKSQRSGQKSDRYL